MECSDRCREATSPQVGILTSQNRGHPDKSRDRSDDNFTLCSFKALYYKTFKERC